MRVSYELRVYASRFTLHVNPSGQTKRLTNEKIEIKLGQVALGLFSLQRQVKSDWRATVF
jgi:hypothetical protein